MALHHRPQRPWPWARWVLVILLPASLGIWAGYDLSEIERFARAEEQAGRLALAAREIITLAMPESFAREVAREAAEPSDREKGPTRHPPQGARPTNGSNDRYRVIPVDPRRDAAFLNGLAEVLAGERPATTAERKAWQGGLGTSFNPEDLQAAKGSPFAVRWGREDAWIVWQPGLVPELMVARAPSPRERFQNAIRRWLERAPPAMRGLLIDHRQGRWLAAGFPETTRIDDPRNPRNRGPHSELIAPALDRARACRAVRLTGSGRGEPARPGTSPEPAPAHGHGVALEGHLAHLEDLGQGLSLYLEEPLAAPGHSPSFWLAGFLVLLGLGSLLNRLGAGPWSQSPFRVRSAGLFLYSVGMPLVAVGILLLGVREDRGALRRHEETEAARHLLFAFDDEFRTERARTAHAFRRLFQDPRLRAEDPASFATAVRSAFARNMADWFEQIRWQPASVRRLDLTIPDDGFNLLMDLMGDQSWEMHPEFRRQNTGGRKGAVQMVLQSSFDSPLIGIRVLLSNPGKLLLARISQNSQFYMWNFWPNQARPTGGVRVIRSYARAVTAFLERETVRNRPYRILARLRANGRWFGIKDPGRERLGTGLAGLAATVQRTGAEQVGEVRVGSRTCLAVGLPGKQLEGADIFALVPAATWNLERADLLRLGHLGLSLVLLVGMLCAWLLWESLLRPIGDLAVGVGALRRRDSRHRIPVRCDDELGKTAAAFNRMLENLDDLALAQEIQLAFLPTATAAPDGYELAWKYRICTSLGGDYLDFMPFSDEVFVVLVADVAGHGIGAGLVMAIAKGIVTNHRLSGAPPERLLHELNRVLHQITGKRRWMTCCLGLLYPRRHRLKLVLAGHPYPWFWKAAVGRATAVGTPGMPLGGRPAPQLTEVELAFDPGDHLLLYSDGLMESLGFGGQPLGFDPVGERFAEAAPQSAEKALADLVALWEWWTQGVPQVDDTSFLTLRRRPLPPGERP